MSFSNNDAVPYCEPTKKIELSPSRGVVLRFARARSCSLKSRKAEPSQTETMGEPGTAHAEHELFEKLGIR